MRPVLFRFHGVEFRAYPVFLFLGLTFGVVAGTYAGIAAGLDATRLYVALLLLIIPALFGSRLLYVLTHLDRYRAQPSLILSRDTGGAALYGGLILALACSWPVLHLLRLPFGAFWDAATVTLLVGMIFTKVGCLLNGCCAGRPTSSLLGINLPNATGVWCRRVPSQLLECGLATVLLLVAVRWTSRPFGGALFLSALTVYAAARIPLGATRENLDRMGRVNIYNAISVALLLAAVGVFAFVWRSSLG